MARKTNKFSKWPLLVVEIIGLGIAVYLSLISAKILHKESIPCPRGALFACASVLRGRHSEIIGIPVAFMGVAYFVVQLILTFQLSPKKKKGAVRWLKFAGVVSGLVFVAYLRVLEVEIKKICPWCWGVALAVILQAVYTFPALVPPLPKMGVFARAGTALASVIVLFGALYGGKQALQAVPKSRDSAGSRKPEPVANVATPKPKIVKVTPEATQPPKKDKEVAQAPATPVPTAPPATPEPEPQPEEQESGEPDTLEKQILRARGWKMVYGVDPIYDAIRNRPPVLLLAFDPGCGECQALIEHELSNPAMDALPVTRLAIEESRLEGKISEIIKNVPTLVLFDAQGIPKMQEEGRIPSGKIIKQVQSVTSGG